MNASGTGKTRTIFEGLSSSWGLYMTTKVDTSHLGSGDIEYILVDDALRTMGFQPVLPKADSLGHKPILASNVDVVKRHFNSFLLSRLLLLRVFLRVIVDDLKEQLSEIHMQQWLRIQLHTGMIEFGAALFEELFRKYLSKGTGNEISQYLEEVWADVKELCDVPKNKFYFVLDEANVVSRRYREAFGDERGPSTLLKEIVRVWENSVGRSGGTIVIVGTDIPQTDFAGEEWNTYRWCSNTGAFDVQQEHEQYIRRFLPESFCSSECGQSLLRCIWCWCRPR